MLGLHEACYVGNAGRVGQLLAAGEDPNGPAPEGREWISGAGPSPPPLNCVAIAWSLGLEHVEIARLLLEHGAVVTPSVVADHNLEMVGHEHDQAFRAVIGKPIS